MYINITTSKLLILTYCTYIKLFLKEAEILTSDVNVIFKEYDKVFL